MYQLHSIAYQYGKRREYNHIIGRITGLKLNTHLQHPLHANAQIIHGLPRSSFIPFTPYLESKYSDKRPKSSPDSDVHFLNIPVTSSFHFPFKYSTSSGTEVFSTSLSVVAHSSFCRSSI
ncbi:hypothetical protein E6O75_ATG05721 [Venturia nashicola]|uniref:Uncharacterized protein n=1 Tax=Venturia nashicola TaxID=86259 RepID=A0A4Z1P8D2_9PEZI|nr:hypothetical protein E6O75_ATG05721 [Venturia nashicola]